MHLSSAEAGPLDVLVVVAGSPEVGFVGVVDALEDPPPHNTVCLVEFVTVCENGTEEEGEREGTPQHQNSLFAAEGVNFVGAEGGDEGVLLLDPLPEVGREGTVAIWETVLAALDEEGAKVVLPDLLPRLLDVSVALFLGKFIKVVPLADFFLVRWLLGFIFRWHGVLGQWRRLIKGVAFCQLFW